VEFTTTPPKRVELWESVLEAMRTAIIKRELAPGTRLVESELAQVMQVSRWPIRQAIMRLEQENLVVRYPNRGAYVIDFTEDDVREIYDLRRLLEGHCAREACVRLTPTDIETLEKHIASLHSLIERSDFAAAADPDIAFHRTIFDIAGSARLRTMWELLVAPVHTLLVLRNARRSRDVSYGTRRAHLDILEALKSGDPNRAEAAAVRHLEGSVQSLVAAGFKIPA